MYTAQIYEKKVENHNFLLFLLPLTESSLFHYVILNKVKNLNTSLYVTEILPPYGRLDDNGKESITIPNNNSRTQALTKVLSY